MLFPTQTAPGTGGEPPRLIGIARFAAESPRLRQKATTEYLELPSRSILNRCSNERMPFRWTINPYRGCEFGCKYCYARYTHEFMGFDDGLLFEQRIYAKAHAAEILRRDLASRKGGAIAIGTSTDPYQPAERRFGVTRSLLEVFAEQRGLSLSITTKSDLVARDVDLLERISARNELSVNVTVTTLNRRLARRLEPRAPRPDLRLGAVERLTARGLTVGVFANPIMPFLTDSDRNLNAVAAAARRAGASYFGGGLLFLMPSAQQQFFPFLEQEFPDLAGRYRERYERHPYLRGAYAEDLRRRVNAIREKHGLQSRPAPNGPQEPPERQLELFDS